MSDEIYEDMDDVVTEIQEVETQEEKKEEPKSSADELNSKIISHMDTQAKMIEAQQRELYEMRQRLEALGTQNNIKQKAYEDEDAEEDDDQPYITKKQLASIEEKMVRSAEQRANKEKIDSLNAILNRSDVAGVLNKMMETDEVFQQTAETLLRTAPIKGRELLIKKAKQALAKSARPSRPLSTSSNGTQSANQVPNQSQQEVQKNVKFINARSSPEEIAAFAENLKKTILG